MFYKLVSGTKVTILRMFAKQYGNITIDWIIGNKTVIIIVIW